MSSYHPYEDSSFSHESIRYPRPDRPCVNRELISNGGFELLDPITKVKFLYWNETITGAGISVLPNFISYKGSVAANFSSSGEPSREGKSAVLSQEVRVEPGLFYRLSFAEYLYSFDPHAFPNPNLSARLFYNKDGAQIELIYIEFMKRGNLSTASKGYTWHEKVAVAPVPSDVTSATVEIRFSPPNLGGISWLVDEVSLRAAPM